AGYPHVGQKIHLQPRGAVALASFAAAAGDVETEAARFIAADLGFAHLRVKGADFVEQFDVGRRVGTRRAADGRLVNIDHLVGQVGADDGPVGANFVAVPIGFRLVVAFGTRTHAVALEQSFFQNVVD